jgi:predicted phage baseplate assembly protein
MPADKVLTAGKYRPVPKGAPLTIAQLFDPTSTAARALIQDVRLALPQVRLAGSPAGDDPVWIPQPDLLGSGLVDQHFVAEIDNDGRAHLRFGDGELGRRPAPNMEFKAVYRVGNGLAGNVGAETVRHVVFREQKVSGAIVSVRNPLPAVGGTAPEPMAEAKLFAPHAFRQQLQRAIIAADYSALVERDFSGRVQRARPRCVGRRGYEASCRIKWAKRAAILSWRQLKAHKPNRP